MKKTDILVWLLLCSLAVGAAFALKHCSRQLPESQCSEVYRRYAHVPGVEAAFVKGFPINDTLGVDVTLLRAADSAGWAYLTEAFNITTEVLQYAETHPEFRIAQNMVLRDHPEKQVAIKGKKKDSNITANDVELRILDYLEKEICIFHTRNASEVAAIFDYNFENMVTNKKAQR